MSLLAGKVALVTGGSSGIGREVAIQLAQQGAILVISDINVEGGEETVSIVRDEGAPATFVHGDVSQEADVKKMVVTAVQEYGRLDIGINNAGISGDVLAKMHTIETSLFDQIMAVNVRGVWLCMQAEVQAMLNQGDGGAIVNIASVAGLAGYPHGAAYSASKHAVVGLTKSAAGEYAKQNIRVNAVCPAFTDTPMVSQMTGDDPAMVERTTRIIPMKRLATPREIAEGIVWLSTDASSFVTGITLTMDGGLTAI